MADALILRQAQDYAGLIERLLQVPYAEGRGDWSGADCWGLVEIAYREAFGVELSDRMPGARTCLDLAGAYRRQTDWFPAHEPADLDLAVLWTAVNRKKIAFGHCGLYWRGGILHTINGRGPAYESCDDRSIAVRLQGYWRHRSFDCAPRARSGCPSTGSG